MNHSLDINKRIQYLDALRGFAILLVIIGHLIQFNYKSSLENPIFNIIYSFHMPLFFFLSGCTRWVYETKKGGVSTLSELWNEVKNKFFVLIVPSMTWTMLIPLFFSKECHFPGQISGFWFLNTLFAISVIWGVFSYLNHRIKGQIWFPILCVGVLVCLFIVGVKRISLMYLMMFLMGYVFQKYEWVHKINVNLYALFALLFCIGVGLFNYTIDGVESAERVWLEFPLSILASFALVRLFVPFESKKGTSWIARLGKYTLGIYLCHLTFIKEISLDFIELGFNNVIQFVILLLIAIILSLLCVSIQKIIEPFPLLNGLMYGKLNKVIKK